MQRIQPAHRLEIAIGQIHYVNVNTLPRPVRRRVILVPVQLSKPADSDLSDETHEVIKCTLGILANQPALVGVHRVEIAQDGYRPVRGEQIKVMQYLFYYQFTTAEGAVADSGSSSYRLHTAHAGSKKPSRYVHPPPPVRGACGRAQHATQSRPIALTPVRTTGWPVPQHSRKVEPGRSVQNA